MHYRLSAASGQVVDEGDGTAVVDGGAVTVSPQLGQPLRITPEQIVEVGEPVPFTVRIGLSDGSAVELSQLGAVRTQLLAQIGDIRVTDARAGLVTIGFGERQRFHGAVDGVDADISLYDDGLVALPVSGPPVQVPYSLIEDVTTDPSGYRISVSMGDAGTVVVQRLAQTTSQLLTLLRQRATAARGRTGAFLQALLPGLGPLVQRQLAGDLRDGVAVPRPTLDAIDPGIWPALIGAAALPERAGCAALIQSLGEPALGFHQITSVEVAAQGTQHFAEAGEVQSSGPGRGQGMDYGQIEQGMGAMMAERFMGVPGPGSAGAGGPLLGGPAGSPLVGGPVGGAPSMGAGMGAGMGMGMGMGPGMGFGAPYGALGGMLAMRMLRGGGAWSRGGQAQARSMFRVPEAPRDPQGQTAAHADLDSLTIGGDHPTIVAFLVARTASGTLVYESLNVEDHATYVFHDPAMSVAQLDLALMLAGFHIEVLAGDVTGIGSRHAEAVRRLPHLARLTGAFRGRAIHDGGWRAQLEQRISSAQ
ncbi:MAG: hypothetical protein WB802_11005 [Candidatus Dormiibacterota bacterium]